LAAAFKPNAAFFEVFGPAGFQALKEVIAAVQKDIPVILDAKRGDIASTAKAYAQAAFEVLGADAVTINPYLGYDALEPFLVSSENAVFMLCKTSNPGAADFQDLLVKLGHRSEGQPVPSEVPLYLKVAKMGQAWNTKGNLGLVVGATQPQSLTLIRQEAPHLWILAPGVGTQGGELATTLNAGLRSDGLGMLVSVSRGISRAEDPRKAASELRLKINGLRRGNSRQQIVPEGRVHRSGTSVLEPDLAELLNSLLEVGCIKFGRFKLKSGIESPIYFDLRRLVGYPQLLNKVAQAYVQILRKLSFDHLAALPYAALPITSAISMQEDWSMVYPRKEVKTYGTKAQVEGVFHSCDKVVVIDDLISTGGSKIEGIQKLTNAGLKVTDVVVLIDRSPDAGAELEGKGYHLHAVLSLDQILTHYENTGDVQPELIEGARNFFANHSIS
jgi:uridine monophosphate synthetase